MDFFMFGLCLVAWELCAKANGYSEEDRQYEDILRSTFYGEVGSLENTTELQRTPKILRQDHVEITGQNLVLPDQTFEINSLSNTDKQENESTKAFTDPPEISSVHTNKKYDDPVVSEKTSNFSTILTEMSKENLQNTPLEISYESKDNDEREVQNDEDNPTVENTTSNNNLDINSNNNEKHKYLSNERETNHFKCLITPNDYDYERRIILLLQQPPMPIRSEDSNFSSTTKNILLKDDLPKVQIENTDLYEMQNPLTRNEACPIDNISEPVSANLDQSGEIHTLLSLREHNVPGTGSIKENNDHYALEAIIDLFCTRSSSPYVPRPISQLERIQYKQSRSKKFQSKNYFDYYNSVYNTEYKSESLPISDNQVQWQSVAGFRLVNYQSGPFGFVPTPKLNQLVHQSFDSNFPKVPGRSGFAKTFYNSKANNWGIRNFNNKHTSSSLYASKKLYTKLKNSLDYNKNIMNF